MSFLKLSMLLFSSASFHLCLGPTAPVDPEDRLIMTSFREQIWRHAGVPSTLFLKATAWLVSAAESMVILGSLRNVPRPPDKMLDILDTLGPAEASRLTFPFAFGAFLVITGGIVRVIAFHTLGPYFTFELCIRKEHKLVKHGPYAIVRHPGYAGLLSCIFGWCVVHGSPGSWLQTSGLLDVMWIRASFLFWWFLMVACIVTLFRRSTEEDQFLSRRFGMEWEGWARKVKYKLIPFVW